jgi:hypothetical protein
VRYIKEYNNFKVQKNEEYLFNYIIGINESYSVNESIISRLKEVSKKGLLTLTLLTSLLSSDAFAQEYKKFDNKQKTEIVNLLKDKNELSVNIGNEFNSGQWKLTEDDKKDILEKLQIIKDFSSRYKNHQLKIKIESSESKVPNKDLETGKRLNSGELSELRFNSTKEIIEKILPNIQIVKLLKTQGPEWKLGDNPNKEEFRKNQYVKVTIVANTETCNLCDAKINYDGKTATAVQKFQGIDFNIDIEDIDSKGEIYLSPGSIPDRAVLYIDGLEVGDTGYFSDKKHQYKDFKLVPLYVYELTKLSFSNSDADAFKNIEKVNIKTVEELNEILLVNKYFKLTKNLGPEVNEPYKALLKMVENSGEKGIDLVTYKTTPQNIEYNIDGESNKMIVKVFSPVSKTGFTGYINCKHKIVK